MEEGIRTLHKYVHSHTDGGRYTHTTQVHTYVATQMEEGIREHTTQVHVHSHTDGGRYTHTAHYTSTYVATQMEEGTVLFIKNWTMYGGQTGVRTVYVR